MSVVNPRKLGRSGLEVSPLTFGGNVFGWTIDEAMSHRLLDAWVGAGFNFIDTADVYARWAPGNVGGESETILGKWLKKTGNRSKVILATKVGMEMGPTEKGLSKRYIQQAVEKSLQRLQTDVIDLYQSHKDDESTPVEETLGAFAGLIQQGKVRAIGASNYSAERLALSLETSHRLGLPRYESLQPLYNLYERSVYENALEPLCQKEEIGVIGYYSLASGFLTGKYRTEADLSQSARGAKVKNYLNERGMRILATLDKVASELQTKPGIVSLAWLLARPSVTAPIVSATSLSQLEDLIASPRLQLPQEAIERLNQVSAE